MGLIGLLSGMFFFLQIGCAPSSPESPVGFRFPEGDVVKGKKAFADLNCIQCHTVSGVSDLPEPGEERKIEIMLGGETSRVKTYGELVTSVIYPGHVIKPEYREKYTDDEGNSLMPELTEAMTVRQMIDLVEFLQEQYEVALPRPAYENYGYPY